MQSPPPHNFALKGGFPSHKLNDILPQIWFYLNLIPLTFLNFKNIKEK